MNHSRSTPIKHMSSSTLFIESKIKPYKERYSSSAKKLANRTPWLSLISKVYDQPPQMPNFKSTSSIRIKSAKKLKENQQINPQTINLLEQKTQGATYKKKPLINDLGMTASQISSYAGLNQKLLGIKKDQTSHITILKQKIKQQNRRLHDLNYNNKVCMNTIENVAKCYSQAHEKRLILETQTNKTQNNIDNLTTQNTQFQKLKIQNQKKLNKLTKTNEHLQYVQVQNLKMTLLKEQSVRLAKKRDLQIMLKRMDNLVIYQKQLQNERAYVLTQINKSVKENQIEV